MTDPHRTENERASLEGVPEARGTLAVLLLYIALLVALWGWTFLLLLQRG